MIGLHSDILVIQQAPLLNAYTTAPYRLLHSSTGRFSNAPALSVLFSVEQHQQPHRWTYAELFTDITRAANLFIRGGHNFDAHKIKDALASYPNVAMSATVGRADSCAGELPVVCVHLRRGSTTTPRWTIYCSYTPLPATRSERASTSNKRLS